MKATITKHTDWKAKAYRRFKTIIELNKRIQELSAECEDYRMALATASLPTRAEDRVYNKVCRDLEKIRGKWINQYYHKEKHIDVTECVDDLGIWIEDHQE